MHYKIQVYALQIFCFKFYDKHIKQFYMMCFYIIEYFQGKFFIMHMESSISVNHHGYLFIPICNKALFKCQSYSVSWTCGTFYTFISLFDIFPISNFIPNLSSSFKESPHLYALDTFSSIIQVNIAYDDQLRLDTFAFAVFIVHIHFFKGAHVIDDGHGIANDSHGNWAASALSKAHAEIQHWF